MVDDTWLKFFFNASSRVCVVLEFFYTPAKGVSKILCNFYSAFVWKVLLYIDKTSYCTAQALEMSSCRSNVVVGKCIDFWRARRDGTLIIKKYLYVAFFRFRAKLEESSFKAYGKYLSKLDCCILQEGDRLETWKMFFFFLVQFQELAFCVYFQSSSSSDASF